MPKMTAGLAKNHIRRALRAVVDPEPSARDITRLWEYFGSACAYCTRPLDRAKREGDVDHLVSSGTNHISNRVLSCKQCNGDEKRDADWQEFLRKKVCDEATLNERRDKIQAWCRSVSSIRQKVPDERVQKEIDTVISTFDAAVKNLRQLRQIPIDSSGYEEIKEEIKVPPTKYV
jgi:hypothetical protein